MQFGYLITHLAAVLGILAGWFNPLIGLMVYYGFAVMRPMELWYWNDWRISRMSYYVAISTLVGWALSGMGQKKGIATVALPMVGLAIYLLAGIVAWRLAIVDRDVAWQFLSLQLKIGLMALVTLTLVHTAGAIHGFAFLIVALLGYLGWVFNSAYFFDGYNRARLVGFAGVDNNGVAMIMVMGVPLAFFLAINNKRYWVKLLCILAVAMMVHTVLLTFSRGGQLGLVIVAITIFAIALFKLPHKAMTLALGLVFVLFALRFAGVEVRQRFWSIFLDSQQRDVSAASRFDTWHAAWMCMKDHPLGVGPRNFNLLSSQYGLEPLKSVHNLFLQTGADYGFGGMIGLAIFYGGTMIKTFFMTRTPTAKRLVWPRYFGNMVCISVGGFLVCSMFIGIESVELGYIISLLGLCTVVHVERIAAIARPDTDVLPELEQVPLPGEPRATHPTTSLV